MKISGKGFLKTVESYWTTLICANALFLPFALPAAAWLVICLCFSAILMGASQYLGGALILTMLGLLPCMLIGSVGAAGLVYSHKQLFWDERGGAAKTFGEGIKQNWARYLLFGFLIWLSLFIAVTAPALYISTNMHWLAAGAFVGVSVLQSLIFIPCFMLMAAETAFYTDSLKNVFANAFKLYFLRPFRLTFFAVISVAPVALIIFLPFVWQLAGWVIYLAALVTFSVTFWLSRAANLFDFVTRRGNT